ncbi:putative Calnexin like protein [Blattamonas nauphoetae]|uniref:Calnexin like protein n=1 Tax=Blattamonas nauphoetae TaxID=2049346 RepID=A0ABQ9YEM3_9EUKA|nr:putative Calnexin like protein [Blattamonas nauphoetae]
MVIAIVAFLTLLPEVHSTIYFKEEFDRDWASRWVESTALKDWQRGAWKWDAPKKYHNKEKARGIRTVGDNRYYQLTADLGKTYSSVNKTLILSYTVKNEQTFDCAGTYIKLLPEVITQENFTSSDPYYVLFGPDICGRLNNKLRFVIQKGQKTYPCKQEMNCSDGSDTHLYTLFIHFTNFTYDVHIDDERKYWGKLWEHFDFMEPPMIPDPDATQPDDWESDPEIPDPKEKMPEEYLQPMTIPDPKNQKPHDWDEETEGVWVQPMIPNPKYKGKWRPKLVKNPNYQGEWKAPLIPNPKYAPSLQTVPFKRIRYVGIDVWQVTAGSLFDNFFIGDDVSEYRQFIESTWVLQNKAEKNSMDRGSGKELFDRRPTVYDDLPDPDDTDVADEDLDADEDEEDEDGNSIEL